MPAVATATQPLETFLAGSKSHNYDAREQAAIKAQRGWESGAALGRILPSLTARGVYTRNQYPAIIPAGPISPVPIAIQKQDQFLGLVQIDVPIVDLANYHRYKQAKHLNEAQAEQITLTGTDVDRAVSRSYFTFLGQSALVESANRTLKIANENYQYVKTRREAGVATDLDLERASANVEQSKQDIASAELNRALAARQLETLTGITPEGAKEFPQDDLHAESDINGWLQTKETPTDRVNKKIQEASVSGKRAAAYALAPTLGVLANEQVANIGGFANRNNYYTFQAVLSWRLDYNLYANAQAQAAATDVQKVRFERAVRANQDTIYEAFRRVEAGIATSKSARAQAAAAKKAAELAAERYQAGASTQLDVTQAQRESFSAEANRIQADTDLAYSRISLRVAAGKPPSLGSQTAAALPAEEQLQTPPTTTSIDSGPTAAPATNPAQPTTPTQPTPAR